ncbi:ATP synthase subunit O, mitochondrial-like [Dromiciops gliroides]|uniref:ATP synthase subunit O, mitochondrial-like n=1 Tax=Dromiciops gliroides TaxID=33562 RepID=UPI001CC33D1F|nr:ATP synthase subunit O, mitochondrial-like [Dromiciops gliroides]
MSAPGVSGMVQQVRRFTTSVGRPFAKLVRPPIQVYGLEGRDATDLYSAASKQNKLDVVENELLRVTKLLKESKTIASIMNPHIKCSVKVKTLNDIIAKEKFSPITTNLLKVLAENGRLNNTPGVISAFFTMMSVHRGEVQCSVTTASTLDEATLSELKTALNSFLSKGQVLKIEVKTDPSIMGRMIVHIGEKYVDMSARSKIQKLSRIMNETI